MTDPASLTISASLEAPERQCNRLKMLSHAFFVSFANQRVHILHVDSIPPSQISKLLTTFEIYLQSGGSAPSFYEQLRGLVYDREQVIIVTQLHQYMGFVNECNYMSAQGWSPRALQQVWPPIIAYSAFVRAQRPCKVEKFSHLLFTTIRLLQQVQPSYYCMHTSSQECHD